jgi:hypothetical protein
MMPEIAPSTALLPAAISVLRDHGVLLRQR